ncbi:MAG: glycosyltransferase family 39 protein [Anaerolineales bacterium]|nr:glycosyltransferase family 39 protein [Anaerolineales bacterium]
MKARNTRLLVGGLLLSTLLAAALRFWQIEALPPGHWYDEAHKSLIAVYILRGWQAPVYITDGGSIEAGYSWLLAGWFALFGPTELGSRNFSALLGVLAVPLTFWAARVVYRDHPHVNGIALVSAFGLAGLFWHVHWSRRGDEISLTPLASMLLLALVVWAWRRNAVWAFALAGTVLGLSQYIAPASRVLPLQALLVFALFAERRLRPVLTFGLVFLAAALLAYAPLGLFFLENPDRFLWRLQTASAEARAGGLRFYLENALKVALMFNVAGDEMLRHNLPHRPALDVFGSVWMWLGLWALARRRDHWRAHAAVLGSLGVNLLTTLLSDGAPGFGRSLGAAPMLMMLLGVGVSWAWERAGRRRWLHALIAASLLASTGITTYDYFWRYPRQPGLFDSFEIGLATLTRAATGAAQTGGAGYLVLDRPGRAHPATRLAEAITPGRFRVVPAEAGCVVYPARTAAPTVIAGLVNWLAPYQAQFPQAAQTDVLHEPEVYPYGAILQLAAGEASATGEMPAIATFGDSFELLTLETAAPDYRPGEAVGLRLRWRARAESPTRYTVFVHLADAANPFYVGADSEPCQAEYPTDRWQAGEIIEHELTLELPAGLAPGRYDLQVGLYEWTTGTRLPVMQAGAIEPDRVPAATLLIR